MCCLHELLWLIPFSVLRAIIIILFFLIPLHYCYKVNRFYHNAFIGKLNFLLAFFSFYGIALILNDESIGRFGYYSDQIKNTTYLIKIYTSLLPFYVFYYFAREGVLSSRLVKMLVPILFFIATVFYYHTQQTNLLMAQLEGVKREEFTNNASYTMLALLPLIAFYLKKPFIQFFLLSYVIAFLLFGMKRGAIIIGGVCLLFAILYSLKSVKSKKNWFWILLLSCVVVYVVFMDVDYLLYNSDYFNYRLDMILEGDVNGRDEILSILLDYFFKQTSFLQFLFGSGAYFTMKIANNFAHNDWVEIAVNQGVFGVVVYVLYWYSLFKIWWKSKSNEVYSYGLGLFIIIYFLRTFFSMSYEDIGFYPMIVLGYCLGQTDLKHMRR